MMDVDAYMAAYRTSGVIVLKDSQVLLERYGLGRTANDVWDAQSVAKSITAILVGAAIQDGYISNMDDLVADYVPQLKSGAFDGVTIRQLFTMSSGVKFDDNWSDPDGNATRFAVWPYANEDPASYLSRLPRADRPGAKWVYSNADAHMAGILVSTATGKFLSAYLAEKLWKPFGMESNAYWMVTPAGREFGDGSISMTLRDYGRVGQFMLEGGKAGGVQVVSPVWLVDATSTQIMLPPETGRTAATGYGYYWWICNDGYFALGHAGQRIYVFPKDNVVIALNSALLEGGSPEDLQALSAFIQALHAAAAQS
ncbi:serine hydrolase [Mesorhizobium sp. M0323]|uniref:serine hydrolase domain-containing protein n=1 Tax=Mesorhizobium sp. M0323 TaxID=2956938 RepID=UPI00333CD84E